MTKLLSKWGARIGKRPRARGHVDAVAGLRVSGWAFAEGPLRVDAEIDGKIIASVLPRGPRRDVGRSFPDQPNAPISGFVLDLPAAALRDERITQVKPVARPASTRERSTVLADLSLVGEKLVARAAGARPGAAATPFPRDVAAVIAAVWPADPIPTEPDEQHGFVERLRIVFRTPELRSVPAIAAYARYLRTCWAHCQFVADYFPAVNHTTNGTSADFHCKPNSVSELFSIIHQLYVLRSYDVPGDFAEFGCFKGYSSAMLSFACQQIGLRMHIFDSFAGLPAAANSGYSEGDYAGSLEEVTRHIRQFGAIDSVEFHEGFFADVFAGYRPPPLLCLWMDVDLEVSARDLMVAADGLDPRSSVFSHDCVPDLFVGGGIVADRSPSNPIPPLVDKFEALGRPLTGRMVFGNIGSFWPRDGGIPVLDYKLLMETIKHVLTS